MSAIRLNPSATLEPVAVIEVKFEKKINDINRFKNPVNNI